MDKKVFTGEGEFIKEFTEKNVIGSLEILERHVRENKRTAGKVLICAGSFGMAGALIMSVRAALRSGAGLVTCYTDREIIPIVQVAEPQAMCIPCDENPDFNEYDSVVFGPGFFVDKGREILVKLLSEYHGKLVIDAEGLNIIAREDMFDLLRTSEADIVITPHEGEASRLISPENPNAVGIGTESRKFFAKKLAAKSDVTLLLKGPNTLVCKALCRLTDGDLKYSLDGAVEKKKSEILKSIGVFPSVDNMLKQMKASRDLDNTNITSKIDSNVSSDKAGSDIAGQDIIGIYFMYVNQTGNPALATGGSGDVLSGMIAAFLAKGMSSFEAGCAGAFLHGKAADIWAGKHGYIGMSFRDLTDLVPDVINTYLGSTV